MNKDNDILKWFNGEISTEDIKTLYPKEDFTSLEKSAFYAKQFEVPQVDVQKALENFKTRSFKKDEPKVIPLNYKSFFRIAAVLVVMLASSYMFFFNNTESYETVIAQIETLNLPDNSEVILNAQSNLAFNKKDWKNTRSLYLEGEAFFNVTKGEKFIVNTNAGSIQVLGTQFNVKERDNYFEVRCYEGSVSVTYKNDKIVLKPGKAFRVVNGEQVVVNDFSASSPSWLTEESSFDNVPLWQVIAEMEIQYDISIITKDVDTSSLFSGSFTHNDKNIALQSVSIPLKLKFKIKGKQVELYNYESN